MAGRGRRGRVGAALRRCARALGIATAALLLTTALVVLVLRVVPPPTSAFMLRARISGETPFVDYRWVPGREISPHLALAVLAAEDQRFPEHRGFDWRQIGEALSERSRGRRARGASTITQQVAKNLFLWPGRSLVRKGIEAYLTLWLELLWSKGRILEVYLNIAQFGPGVFGAEAASRGFFAKPASRLTAAEAARLAAVLPNPVRMRAGLPSPYVRARAAEVEAAMARLGGLAFLERL